MIEKNCAAFITSHIFFLNSAANNSISSFCIFQLKYFIFDSSLYKSLLKIGSNPDINLTVRKKIPSELLLAFP
jgi:hypothetical protein